MKRYLTFLFVLLSIITVIIGYRFEARWSGIVTWGLVFTELLLAAFFTKQIPNKNKKGNQSMNYFAVYLPMKDEEKSQTYRQKHLDFLAEMRKENRIFLFGRLTDGTGGLIIYQGDTLEQVDEWAKQDPYVTLGARGYEIREWAMQTDYTFDK